MSSNTIEKVISPKEHFGFEPGEDRKLAGWPQIIEYFQSLERTSDRVLVQDIGETTEGNPFLMVTISSPENLASLDEYQQIQERLADPRTISDKSEAQEPISRGKVIVAITCSIHATEVGATQMSPLLGHHLATSDDEKVRRILDNVIVLLIPSLNPDGLIKVKEWYDSTIGTNYEGMMPPFLYHKYTGHDNNRDWFMFTQAETKLMLEHCLNAWHPQILFDLHQTRSNGMRMILPPPVDPVGPNVDPILQSQLAMLGTAMAAELTSQDKAGVAVNLVYDAYSPSRTYQHYHAGIRLLSEAASTRIASPIDIHPSQLRAARGESPTQKSWNHPMPWKGGRWSLRNIVDYNFSAVMACLNNAAHHRESWVSNFYKVGKRASTQSDGTFAFIIPQHQRDPNTVAELLEVMRAAKVEIHEATEVFQVDGQYYPAGTNVILMGQPYGAFAKTLLETQSYPDMRAHPGGPPKAPYDVTAHCLPLQMGVEAVEAKTRFATSLKLIEEVERPTGGIVNPTNASAKAYLLRPEANASARAINRLLSQSANIRWAREPLRTDNGYYPQGTFTIDVTDEHKDLVSAIGKKENLSFEAIGFSPDSASYTLTRPRIGLYQSYVPAVEEGWTRFILEEYGFNYTTLVDSEIREGSLAERFDCIILPHQPIRHLHRGHNASHYHPQYSGGLGDKGAEKLREFASDGGTIITWDGSARYAIQHLELPVKNVLGGLTHSDFFAPGSLLNVMLDTNHPIAYGMPNNTAAMFYNSPAFDVREGRVVGKYPLRTPLQSGWIIGPDKLYGKTAIATVPIGKGEVILIGFRVHFRAQARGTYKILFNSLIYSAARRNEIPG